MRDLLFRGKRLDKDEWVVGYYVRLHDPFKKRESHRIYTGYAESELNGNECLFYPDYFDVDPTTVGQFTGLNDKNGKKVFEGDVLRISRKMDGMGTYYVPPLQYPVKVVVKWDMCAWMWKTIEQDRYYISFPNAWCHYDCEVIGNIHDNPKGRNEE